jgi:PAS domain S-box-containing protein
MEEVEATSTEATSFSWQADALGGGPARDAALRAQAELLELAHDAIFVRDVDESRIVYWNRGAEQLYGISRSDAIGAISHELLQTEFPEPRDQVEATVIASGLWEGELVHRTPDGRTLAVESRWALQRSRSGSPRAFLEVNRDVTARKAVEHELHDRVAELDRRHRELAAVNASMTAVSRALDLKDVLQSIVDAARDLVHARYAALGVVGGNGRITDFITSGITAEERVAIGPLPEGHGLLKALIVDATPLRVENIGADRRSHGFPPNHPPMTNLLGVPIVGHGVVRGNLYLTDKIDESEFSEDDERLLLLLASHAAVAIENAHLYDDVRSARDQLRIWNRDLEAIVADRTREIERLSRETTTRVLQAQEEERKRIARELHDETAQSLATLLINLDLLKPFVTPDNEPLVAGLDRLGTTLQRTLEEVRALAHDLRPTILDDFGLAAAIKWYAGEWRETFAVPVDVDLDGLGDEPLAPTLEVVLFRIVQEALMNAGKYAHASHVAIKVTRSPDSVLLRIADDGIGFDPEARERPTQHGGLGLFGMQERAALVGGTLTIESGPGRGTTITVVCPVG